jgi:hypothetical protein
VIARVTTSKRSFTCEAFFHERDPSFIECCRCPQPLHLCGRCGEAANLRERRTERTHDRQGTVRPDPSGFTSSPRDSLRERRS